MTSLGRGAVGATLLLLLPGCTSFADTLVGERTSTPSAESSPSTPTCPTDRAEPDPDRPVIDLRFRLDDDRRTVTGTETVVFTPDLATGELVFRLVPNAPDSAEGGSRLTVEDVRGDDVVSGRYEQAGAADPGGLYVIELEDELAPGTSTEVELDFRITLGKGSFDRLGVDEGVSWWASGAPLLAWEPGVGWAKDPFVGILGETTTSPAADTTVTVSAPAELTVLMTGNQKQPSAVRDGRRTWTSREPAARDVSVAAGRFGTEDRTTPDGVRVTAGVLPGAELTAAELADLTAQAIADLAPRLGPFPYRTLTVALLPDYGGGIEYPGAILQATPDRDVLVHEVAHMWFYGMVGNSQFRDPWLDEAFATYAEALTGPPPAAALDRALNLEEPVGAAMSAFDASGRYFAVVYRKGGAALLRAREAAGPAAFDAAVRCYADGSAWAIATPEDLAAVLRDLPAAVDVLRQAGALQEEDLQR